MPEGTKVAKVYHSLLGQHYSKESAAKLAQSITHKSLLTGKAPKKKSKNHKSKHGG